MHSSFNQSLRMKALFGCLLCLAFTISQSFAIGGGPVYGNGQVSTTGTYAGVMMPGELSPGANSIGLFSILIPKTGLGSGNVIIFEAGQTYTGTFNGTADPDTAKMIGELDAEFPYIEIIQTVDKDGNIVESSVTVAAKAAGQLSAQLSGNQNIFSSASVRLKGTADIQFSLTVNNPFNEIVYDVVGFKQAEATL